MDKQAIKKNFNRAADTYDEYAALQQLVLERLVEMLPAFRLPAGRVLDLGSGTGHAVKSLQQAFPKHAVCQVDIAENMLRVARRQHKRWFRKQLFVCADAERLPFSDNSLSLVFSSLMLQWSHDLQQALAEQRRVLQPGGLCLLATLGQNSLNQLRQSWADSGAAPALHLFPDIQQLGQAMMAAGFDQPVLSTETITLTYASIRDLFNDLKHVGAANAHELRNRGLTGKQRMKKFLNAYEALRNEERLPLSYEIIYAHAWRRHSSGDNNEKPVTFVSKQALRRNKS